MDEMLNDIEVPSLDVPDLDASSSSFRDESKNLFAEKKRAAWKDVLRLVFKRKGRCDFVVRVIFETYAIGALIPNVDEAVVVFKILFACQRFCPSLLPLAW